MPLGIYSRAADNWKPLLAIADAAGGEWPQRARDAASKSHAAADVDDASMVELLLVDIRDAFTDKAEMPSGDLVKALVELEGRPWAELGKSRKPLTQNRLARMLKPLRIAPQLIGPREDRTRGYVVDHFTDAFDRYLASEEGAQPFNRSQRDEMATSDISKPFTADDGCTVEKCEKSNNDGPVNGRTVAKGGSGENARTAPPDGDEPPPLMPCAHCGRADGDVYRMNDLSRGTSFDPSSGAPRSCPVVYLHEACAQPFFAARATGLPGQGNGQGERTTASVVRFMITQEVKRRLRICGYSDEQIAHLTPQQAHGILAQQGWQPDA